MIPNKFIFRIFMLMVCMLILFPKYGSGFFSAPQNQRETAINLFQEGQYEKALPLFTKLTYDFPYDFLLKYFTGACLVETGDYGVEAEKNLILSSSKEVPSTVFYYLGKLYHARGSWNSAQRYYNRFTNNSDTLQVKDLKIKELSDLCYRQINPFAPAGKAEASPQENEIKADVPAEMEPASGHAIEIIPAKPQEKEEVAVTAPEILLPELSSPEEERDTLFQNSSTVTVDEPASGQTLTPEMPVTRKYIHFRINDKVTYLIEDMFQEKEALKEFILAEAGKIELYSLLDEMEGMRKRYHEAMNPVLRDSLAQGIRKAESRSLLLKGEVDTRYRQAAALENEWWKDADYTVYQSFALISDSVEKLRMQPPAPVVLPEAVVAEASADSISAGEVEPDLEDAEAEEDAITYRIQIGAYNKTIPSQRKILFDKIAKIRVIETYINDDGATVHTTGNLTSFGDAVKLQNQVRLEGVKDAFVIAMKGGKRIPLPK